MATTIDQPDGIDRRAEVREALARYPYVNDAELGDLLHWFRREASALEVATMASEPGIVHQYQRFKAEHLDRLRGVELFWIVIVVILIPLLVIMVGWTAV